MENNQGELSSLHSPRTPFSSLSDTTELYKLTPPKKRRYEITDHSVSSTSSSSPASANSSEPAIMKKRPNLSISETLPEDKTQDNADTKDAKICQMCTKASNVLCTNKMCKNCCMKTGNACKITSHKLKTFVLNSKQIDSKMVNPETPTRKTERNNKKRSLSLHGGAVSIKEALRIVEEIYNDVFDGFSLSSKERRVTNSSRIKSLEGFGSSTYGEILPESVPKLVQYLDLDVDSIFYDLGSGVGKVCIQIALQSCCKTIVGVELSVSRYQASVTALQNVQTILKKSNVQLTNVEFKNLDILQTELRACTHVYWNNVCFSDEAHFQLLTRFRDHLKRGTKIACCKKLCARHNEELCLMRDKLCTYFSLVKEDVIECTWADKCPLYIYERK